MAMETPLTWHPYKPVCQPHWYDVACLHFVIREPRTFARNYIGASTTSSDGLDPLASLSNTKNKNMSPDGINHQKEFLSLTRQEYMERIRELNDRLDMVKNIARPGCSYELLNTALYYMSSLATILSEMPQKLHASL